MCMVLTRRAKSCASAAHEASEPLQAQECDMTRTGRAYGVIEVPHTVRWRRAGPRVVEAGMSFAVNVRAGRTAV